MMNFNFIATDKFELKDFNDLEKFVERYTDFQTVVLENEYQLMQLLELIGIDDFNTYELNEHNFSKYWDLSNSKLPEYNEEQFDRFYSKWIESTGKANNMDEYGNLIFLYDLSCKWNQMEYRLIVLEK